MRAMPLLRMAAADALDAAAARAGALTWVVLYAAAYLDTNPLKSLPLHAV